jgi:CubicO group peptidase (beta-lactamase class C family)
MYVFYRNSYRSMCLILLSVIISCQKQEAVVDLSKKGNILNIITAEKNIQGMNSIAFCLVKDDSLLWADAMGYADKENHRLATPDTRYLIASVSKSITGTAVMQLYDQGLFGLDDDVNKFLPFHLANPNHPDDAITFRMLLNHTSSLQDNINSNINLYCWGFDCPKPLGDFLYDFFSPDGSNYSKDFFYAYKPGEKLNYSNNNYVFLGYLVELIAQQPFDAYCKEYIFEPLGMQKTEWRLANVPANELAIPYGALFTPSDPNYTFIDYPDGGLRTTITDLSRFLRMIILKGTFNGQKILRPETVELMKQTNGIKDNDGLWYGLGLLFTRNGNFTLCGHDGGEQGVTTQMFYDSDSGTGAIVFTNTSLSYLNTITNALIQYGVKL